jgi:hypothetical protein
MSSKRQPMINIAQVKKAFSRGRVILEKDFHTLNQSFQLRRKRKRHLTYQKQFFENSSKDNLAPLRNKTNFPC